MDGSRFDKLTRSLSTAGSRRCALSAVLGGGLGIALAASVVDEAAAKKKCPPCKKRKNGKCKKKKPNGTACPGGTCQSGSCCVADPQATTCAEVACGTATTNNCGQAVSCPCPSGQSCLVNGSCALPCDESSPCPSACVAGCPAAAWKNAEGVRHCYMYLAGTPCATLRTCTSTSQCPRGTHCAGCSSPTDLRCLRLCTG
jgi:hypothetical protein